MRVTRSPSPLPIKADPDFLGKPIRAWHLSQITACVCYGSAVSYKTMISITTPRGPSFSSVCCFLFLRFATRDTGSCLAGGHLLYLMGEQVAV